MLRHPPVNRAKTKYKTTVIRGLKVKTEGCPMLSVKWDQRYRYNAVWRDIAGSQVTFVINPLAD